MSQTRVAVLVGSLRADSVNRKLAELLRDRAPAGVTLDLVDGLGALPFYNEDIDTADDVPAAAAAFRARVAAADRVLAVTPEYNGTIPTPYGGKWSHADAARSAQIAGAVVVEDVTVSQSAIDVDVLTDPEVLGRLHDAVARLVDFQQETVAA